MFFHIGRMKVEDVTLQYLGSRLVVTGKHISTPTNKLLDVKIDIDLKNMCLNNSSLYDNYGQTYQLYINDMMKINCTEFLDFWCGFRMSEDCFFDSRKEIRIIQV
tara:strand:- start:753 stop:1067 length:315 start_codon:yes stop_codon:yes gene_type:complete